MFNGHFHHRVSAGIRVGKPPTTRSREQPELQGAAILTDQSQALIEIIARLNAEHGKTFLIIEHDMDLVARLCDPVVVMTEGRRLVEGPFSEVRRDPRVIEAYLGGAAGGDTP